MTDDILLLPLDILVHIFRKLNTSDLRNVMLTCKTLRDVIKNDSRIWRSFCRNSVVFRDREGNRWYNILTWYNRCRISRNWQNGCYKSKELIRHYTNYMPWLKFYNSEVMLLTIGSELVCHQTDNKGVPICNKRLWKIDVPKVLRQDVRTNDISRFVLKNNLLVCGNRDGCVAVYRLNNILKRPKLECHIKDCHDDGLAEVSDVEVIDSRDQLSIVSGSSSSSNLLICTLRTGDDARPVQNSNQNVMYIPLQDCIGTKCLSLNKMADRLAIGLKGNSQPVLLDVNNAKMLLTAKDTMNHRRSVRDIQWHDENTVVYVTHSGFLQLMDMRTHQGVYKARDPFQSTLYCVKTDGENAILVGSAEYSRCVLFDARNSRNHVQMYFTQRNSSPVYSLDFDSTKLITAVDRGVAVLNFNVDSTSQPCRDYSSHVFQ
ncbi:unnamed protein product [Arctia plantaginis]|uniref:F-box domain-containing protein n=1 Tax=Arctia plantaginis TaxID=874455 RepID=A0A8S0ZNX5_ARCPL|nr:unnamed protein product [Arctia plantaginis]CAB3238407.1 unnamed protein product [Arctia plantaginis]